jgi:hypothetical protein
MAEFLVGDKVKVRLPQGYSKRGVFGISVLYSTSPEARFEGAIGTIKGVNTRGPYTNAQYLVDFRGQDNSRLALPWQAHWFREEWLEFVERAATDSANPVAAGAGPGRADGPAS